MFAWRSLVPVSAPQGESIFELQYEFTARCAHWGVIDQNRGFEKPLLLALLAAQLVYRAPQVISWRAPLVFLVAPGPIDHPVQAMNGAPLGIQHALFQKSSLELSPRPL